jgi:3-deoxy-D-manno-octulosonic-acid transferase
MKPGAQERLSEWLARKLYTVAGLVMLPFLAGYLLWRGVQQPAYFARWSERFLGLALSRRDRPFRSVFRGISRDRVLWVHAVSVGETRAVAPLVRGWLDQGHDYRVVLTHTTPTGLETGRSLFADDIPKRLAQHYLPYDLPWANSLFLSWARPGLAVFMETELWPNLLASLERRGCPALLVNARLSERSARRMRRFHWLARPALRRLSVIVAQTQEDADRLVAEGARRSVLEVSGNMKFDLAVPENLREMGRQWRSFAGERRIWLAASTRDDEEIALLEAWRRARDDARLSMNDLLVLVPRHPQRFDRVARLIEGAGLGFGRRSLNQMPQKDQEVWLGDSLGEMFAYLELSNLVLVGGSLLPLGGQNPLEACAMGRPVFFGRHMFNFHQIAQALETEGLGKSIQSVDDWIKQGARLLDQPEVLVSLAKRAQEFMQSHQGASQRTLDLLVATGQRAR